MYLQTLIVPLALLAGAPLACPAQEYARLLAEEWKQAAGYVAVHRAEWNEVFASLDVVPAECEAIVFPELLRYSRLQDGLEKAVVQTLYVQAGSAKGNFSIGMFQMKPSFAEEVEKAWMHSPLRHDYKLYFDLRDNRTSRSKRIERLGDKGWQCVYLALFVRLMLLREPQLREFPTEERVCLLATAYNYSFTVSLDTLRQKQSRRSFHLDLLPGKKTRYYSYAGIAAEWYRYASEEQLLPLLSRKTIREAFRGLRYPAERFLALSEGSETFLQHFWSFQRSPTTRKKIFEAFRGLRNLPATFLRLSDPSDGIEINNKTIKTKKNETN